MNPSRAEEVIAALWTICCLLCLVLDEKAWAVVFGIKAVLDILCCIRVSLRDLKERL